MHVASPFTHPSVVKHALRLSKADCVREGGVEGGATPPQRAALGGLETKSSGPTSTGKMPLRRAFPEVTSAARAKDPIEVRQGSGAGRGGGEGSRDA